MKKSILIIAVAAVLILAGCSEKKNDSDTVTTEVSALVTTAAAAETLSPEDIFEIDGDTYRITEERYLEGVQEIYNNSENYIGKRIEFEGEYIAELYEDEMYFQVYRNITLQEHHVDEDSEEHVHTGESYPIGFRIRPEGNLPMDKTFVRVSGIVEEYDVDGEAFLIINADVLEKCETAGNVNLVY